MATSSHPSRPRGRRRPAARAAERRAGGGPRRVAVAGHTHTARVRRSPRDAPGGAGPGRPGARPARRPAAAGRWPRAGAGAAARPGGAGPGAARGRGGAGRGRAGRARPGGWCAATRARWRRSPRLRRPGERWRRRPARRPDRPARTATRGRRRPTRSRSTSPARYAARASPSSTPGPGWSTRSRRPAAPGAGVDLSGLNLARLLVDGEQILVGVPAPAAAPPAAARPGRAATPGVTLVNLNTADLAELETLPEVGPVTAQAIVDLARGQRRLHRGRRAARGRRDRGGDAGGDRAVRDGVRGRSCSRPADAGARRWPPGRGGLCWRGCCPRGPPLVALVGRSRRWPVRRRSLALGWPRALRAGRGRRERAAAAGPARPARSPAGRRAGRGERRGGGHLRPARDPRRFGERVVVRVACARSPAAARPTGCARRCWSSADDGWADVRLGGAGAARRPARARPTAPDEAAVLAALGPTR